MEKAKTTRLIKRIAALQYNPYFQEEVKQLRKEFEIPEDSNEAWIWYEKHIEDHKKNIRRKKKKGEKIEMDMVPLDAITVKLLKKYKIPEALWRDVSWYIVSGDKQFLDNEWVFSPKVTMDFNMSRPYFDMSVPISLEIRIYGIGPWTIKENWDSIWYKYVQQTVQQQRAVYRFMTGQQWVGKKRAKIASCYKEMQRYSEWYRLSEIEGMGPKEALEKWEKEHTDERGQFDLSTVVHAVAEFRKITSPMTNKELQEYEQELNRKIANLPIL